MARHKKNDAAPSAKESQQIDAIDKMTKFCGGKLLKDIAKKNFINTGNFALNYICSGDFFNGGIPAGITEILGPPATSKSLLGYTLLGTCQRQGGIAILLDVERAANPDFMESAAHVNVNTLAVFEPRFIEELTLKVAAVTNTIRSQLGTDIPILFVWDSIGSTPCAREWRENDLPSNPTKEQFKKIVGANEQPGERAKAAGKALRKLNPFLSDNNASMLVINQIRSTIGSYGNPVVGAGGGKALEFYENCRIYVTAKSKPIVDNVKKIPVGIFVTYKNKKSRSFTPFLSAEDIPLFFDKGIYPIGGILRLLIIADRIKEVGRGKYQVLEPYANGKEIIFNAKLEKNDIPIDVLINCPSIINAPNAEAVRSHIEIYSSSIDSLNNENLILDMSDEDLDEGESDYDDIFSQEE